MWFVRNFVLMAFIIQLSFCDDSIELSCRSKSDCASYQDKMTLSTCHNSSCRCLSINNSTPVNCTPKKVFVNNKIGGACPCDFPNSHCVLDSNTCVCDDNSIVIDKERCVAARVHLNKPCEMNEQCVRFDKNSGCIDGVCQCLENFTMHGDSCRSLVKIGEHCDSPAECHKFTSNVTCLDHLCICENNFSASENGNFCIPTAYYLESCKENTQCEIGLGPGSVCDSGKCVCDSNHRNITDNGQVICQRKVRYGDECKKHADCAMYLDETKMHCFQHKCVCRNNFELFDAYGLECVKTNDASHKNFPPSIVFLILVILVYHF